jgi:hypothetical protein
MPACRSAHLEWNDVAKPRSPSHGGRQASEKELAKVEAGCSELFRSRRIAAGAGQLAVLAYEDLRRLDDPVFDPAGDADDLVYPTSTLWLDADVHDEVDGGR